jgi:predicted transcriptional regulator
MALQVELPEELIARIDNVTEDREAFIVAALRQFLDDQESQIDEIERINAVAEELNREAAETLDFQVFS